MSNPSGPYEGKNPPPNSGSSFLPLKNAAAGEPPPVGLIVRKDAGDVWRDDNNIQGMLLKSKPRTGYGSEQAVAR